jgi:hypothetical protein
MIFRGLVFFMTTASLSTSFEPQIKGMKKIPDSRISPVLTGQPGEEETRG